MAILLTPYVHFVDNAQEALDFYKGIFGGEAKISKFGEFGTPDTDPSHNLIMHSDFKFGGTQLFLSDSLPMGGVKQGGENVELALHGNHDDEATLTKYFNALAEGGTVTVPFETAPWGAKFGMLIDKFNIRWMVNIDQP
jgi:PhnB protein